MNKGVRERKRGWRETGGMFEPAGKEKFTMM
jgi:hypothetical protein